MKTTHAETERKLGGIPACARSRDPSGAMNPLTQIKNTQKATLSEVGLTT